MEKPNATEIRSSKDSFHASILGGDIHILSANEWSHQSDYTKREWSPARITWTGGNTISPIEAIEFANALLWAAKEAKKHNNRHVSPWKVNTQDSGKCPDCNLLGGEHQEFCPRRGPLHAGTLRKPKF